jgi:hypothetical protein
MQPVPLFRDRRLYWLLALGLGLRLWIGFDVWRHDPTARGLLSDSLYYKQWAQAIASGSAFAFEGESLAYWMPPLYPWLLALLNASVVAMLFLQGALGLVTTALIVDLGERLLRTRPAVAENEFEMPSKRRAALYGGLLWTLYGPVIFFEGRLLGATLATFLGTVGLWLAICWRDRVMARQLEQAGRIKSGPPWKALGLLTISGIALGLMALARPNTLLSIPAVGLWVWWIIRNYGGSWPAALGRAALFGLAALLPLLPALQHNHAATGKLIPVTVNGGVNFYFANNPQSHGTFHAPGIQWGSIFEQRTVAREQATTLSGAAVELSDTEASAYWMRRGLDYLMNDPAGGTRLWALKFADLMSSTEFGIQYNLRAARDRAPSLWLVCLPFGVLLFLIAVGWRRTGTRILWPWLLAGLVGVLLYFTYSRFRLPLLPPLMACAGLGLERLLTRRMRTKGFLVGLTLAGLSVLPFEGTYPDHLRSKAFLDMALATENVPERALLLDKALHILPGNKPARVERAKLALRQGDATRALAELEAAVALPVDYPEAELQLASFLHRIPDPKLQNPARARRLLETWMEHHDPAHPFAEDFRALLSELP